MVRVLSKQAKQRLGAVVVQWCGLISKQGLGVRFRAGAIPINKDKVGLSKGLSAWFLCGSIQTKKVKLNGQAKVKSFVRVQGVGLSQSKV